MRRISDRENLGLPDSCEHRISVFSISRVNVREADFLGVEVGWMGKHYGVFGEQLARNIN